MACEGRVLLAVHASFWARRKRRWGLPGGAIEYREDPATAVRRELREELRVDIDDLTDVGDWRYKGARHKVFGATVERRPTWFDRRELLKIGWFQPEEVAAMAQGGRLHAGYELDAIRAFAQLTGEPYPT